VKEELRLITMFVQVLSVMHDLHTTSSTRDSIRLLVENGNLHRGLGMAISIFLEWLLTLRVRIHQKAGCKDDRFFPSRHSNEVYVLSELEQRRWHLFSTMISTIVLEYVRYLHDREQLPSISNNLSPDRERHLSKFFTLLHEDELLVFREKAGLSKTAPIDNRLFWEHPIILRSNYYFEMAVECSVDGAQAGFKKLVSEFFEEHGYVSSLREQYSDMFFAAEDEMYGRRKVIPLSSQVHLKFFPELPGQECFAAEFTHRITGYTASFSVLRKDLKLKPLLISKTVIGVNLQDLLKENPKVLEEMIDDENFSWQFIRTVLLNPEDDKPDNFMVLAYFDEWAKVKRYKLVCVDNDHTLSEPINSGFIWNELLVKSIIYCSESKMKICIHPTVINYFSSITLEELVLDVCEAIVKRDSSAQKRFSQEELCQESKATSNSNEIIQCKIPVLVSEDSAVRLYKKLTILRNLMASNKDITHLMVLSALEPVLGNCYGKLLTDPSSKELSTFAKFERITSGLYTIIGLTRATKSDTNKILRSACGKAPTVEEIKNRTVFTSGQMLQKFKDVLPHRWTNQVAEVRRHLLKMTSEARHAYYKLPDEDRREEVISGRLLTNNDTEPGINFRELSETQQAFIIRLIRRGLPSNELNSKPHTFNRLLLRYCEVLTDDDLFRIMKNSPKLQVLDVRDCSKITKDTLDNLKAAYPSLKIVHDPFKSAEGFLSSFLLLLYLNEGQKFGIDEAIETLENMDKGNLKDSAVGLVLAQLDLQTKPLSDIPLPKLEKLIQLALKGSFHACDVRVLRLFMSVYITVEETNFSLKTLRNVAQFCVVCCEEWAGTNIEIRDRLVLQWTITKLLCTLPVITDVALRERLMNAFPLISVDTIPEELELYEVFSNTWLPLLCETELPDVIVNAALGYWYVVEKKKGLRAISDIRSCRLLSKLLFQSKLKPHLFIFILQSLGKVYQITPFLLFDEPLASKQQLDSFIKDALTVTDAILANKFATAAFIIQCANILERTDGTTICLENYSSLVYFVGRGLCMRSTFSSSAKRKLSQIWCDRFEMIAKNLTNSELLELSMHFLDCEELAFEYKGVLLFARLTREQQMIPDDSELTEILKMFQKQLLFVNGTYSSSSSEMFVLLLIVYILAYVPRERISPLLPEMELLASKIIRSTESVAMKGPSSLSSSFMLVNNSNEEEDDGESTPFAASSSDDSLNMDSETTESTNDEDDDVISSLHLLKDKSKAGDAIKDILTSQIAMLLKQKLPEYLGALIRSDLATETPDQIGSNIVDIIRVSLSINTQSSPSAKQFSKLMKVFIMRRMIIEGLSVDQQLQLITCLLNILETEPDSANFISDCLICMIKRGLLGQSTLTLPIITAAVEITNSHGDGDTRQCFYWILVLLLSSGALDTSIVDNLMQFLLSKTRGEGHESFDSARHNCFLGLLQIVEHYQLTREQALLMRCNLKESLRWNSVMFKNMQTLEKDELEELLNGKIFERLTQVITSSSSSAAAEEKEMF
jgi:hypothetical protein